VACFLGGTFFLSDAASAAPGPGAGAAPAPADSQPAKAPEDPEKAMAEAKSRYKAGLSLYDDGAYEAARVQFERAYQLAPSYKILYNIGLVYKQLNEFVGSLRALTRYLKEGGAEVPDDRKAEVQKMVDSLKTIIATATVRVTPPGADITVDDENVGKAPLPEPLWLNPGRRKIGAKIEGRLPENRVITVASGDAVNVDLELKAIPKAAANPYVTRTVIGWGSTAVLGLGSGILAYFASQAADDLKTKRDTLNVTRAELDDAESSVKTRALIADILFGATIVAAAVSTYFTVRLIGYSSSTEEDKSGEKDKRATKSGIKLDAGISPMGGALMGRF
jgi:tetratricopeptide (TPR) repeat protein